MFEDDFPFPKLGYINSLEGKLVFFVSPIYPLVCAVVLARCVSKYVTSVSHARAKIECWPAVQTISNPEL